MIRKGRCWNCGKEAEETVAIYDAFYCTTCAILMLLEKVEMLERLVEEEQLVQ